MQKQILFVDDDRFVLEGLRRLLRPHRHVWSIHFASSGMEALQLMQQQPIDVIVSDMRMPVMDGAELLSTVRERHPRTVRIILSGQSEEDARLRAVGPAHQYLSKPCDAEALRTTIERACVLRQRLDNAALRKVVSRIETLPSLPRAYQQLFDELQAPTPSLQRVGEIISSDIAMTAKILQLVNSSFFGLARRITCPERAVQWLGLKRVEPLILAAGVFSQVETGGVSGLNLSTFMDHSLAVATSAKQLMADASECMDKADDAFLAGMLHDVGKLVLAFNLPRQYEKVMDAVQHHDIPVWKAELEVFDASHSEVGAYLAGLWGLPDPVVEAIAFHHDPQATVPQGFTPLVAVHVANALEHSPSLRITESGVDQQYLDSLGLLPNLPKGQEQVPLPTMES